MKSIGVISFFISFFISCHFNFEVFTCRRLVEGGHPKFIFTSSLAVFGETYTEAAVGDTEKIVPKNTYGMTKACGELLVNDYTRRGFVDGRTARLPTVIVRPGKPNAATTSCFSGRFLTCFH